MRRLAPLLLGVATISLVVLAWLLLRVPDEAPGPRGPGKTDSDTRFAVPPDTVVEAHSDGYEGEDAVSVAGLVLRAIDGGPIAGARVSCRTESGEWWTTTDMRGEWSLALPPTRSVMEEDRAGYRSTRTFVRADAPGFAPVERRLRPWRGELRAPTLYLRRTAANLSGTVADADGNPVEGATLQVIAARNQETIGPAVRTDDRGRFGRISVGPGRYRIRVRASGFGVAEREILVHPVRTSSPKEVHFVLSRGLVARGRVVTTTGEPVAGARIQSAEGPDFAVTADANGRFLWSLSPAVPPRVLVSGAGIVGDRDDGYLLDPAFENTLVVHRASVLNGVVLFADGRPAAGLEVAAWHERDGFAHALTDREGRFRLDPIRPGRHEVFVMDGRNVCGEYEETVGAEPTEIELRLRPVEPFELRVVDALTGLPIEGASLRPVTGAGVLASSDAAGRIRLPEPFHSESRLAISKDGYLPFVGQAKSATVELAPLVPVRLTVKDDAGNPIPGTLFMHLWTKGWPGWIPREAYADAGARAVLELGAGRTYRIFARHPIAGEAEVSVTPGPGQPSEFEIVLSRPPGLVVVVVDQGGKPVADTMIEVERDGAMLFGDGNGRIHVPHWIQRSGTVLAPGGGAWVNLTGTGERRVELVSGASIEGRVVSPEGVPLSGVAVSSWGGAKSVTSDGHGRFRIDDLAAGRAILVETAEGPGSFAGLVRTWAVPGGEGVVLTVPRSARLTVVVDGEVSEDAEIDLALWWLDGESRWGDRRRSGGARSDSDSPLSIPVPSGRLRARVGISPGALRLYELPAIPPGGEAVIEYDFPPPGRLEVQVVGPEGEPVSGAYLRDALSHDTLGRTDTSGMFAADPKSFLFTGPLRLLVEEGGFVPSVTEPVDLAAGVEMTVRLERGGRVKGTLLGPDGAPVNGRVRLRRTIGAHGRWTAARDGRFDLRERVAAGRCTLEVRGENGLPFDVEVGVSDSRDNDVRITVPRQPK